MILLAITNPDRYRADVGLVTEMFEAVLKFRFSNVAFAVILPILVVISFG